MRRIKSGSKQINFGFTLIELLVFVVISSLLISTLVIASINALRTAPSIHNQLLALQTARRCMEWYVGQSRLNGSSTLTCPSTPTPALCSAPTGFSVTTSISCTTWNSDSTYKTITVSVAGLAPATLTLQLGVT